MSTRFSLSTSASSTGLDISEVLLLLFGVLLTAGLIGEYAKSDRWKKHVKTFEMLVIIGVAGELLADGGIFLFSRHLQIISEQEIAKAESKLLEERQHTANRDILPEEEKTISETLKAFVGEPVQIDLFPVTFESRWIAEQIRGILINAKWAVPPVNMLSSPPSTMVQGILIQATGDTKSRDAAAELSRLLSTTVAAGIFDQMPLSDPSHPRVWMLVGDKPTPLRSWVK